MLVEAVCLATAIYFEARNQDAYGQMAVAEVIINRVESPKYPDTVCEVVQQDLGPKPRDCQFSYMCDGKPEHIKNRQAFQFALEVALELLKENSTLTKGALYYHATRVKPRWARKLKRTAVIGDHVFYK